MKRLFVVGGVVVLLAFLAGVFFVGVRTLAQEQPAAKGPAGKKAAEKPGPAEPKKEPVKLPEGIVARVNGQDITRRELMERCFRKVAPQILQEIIIETVVEQEAKKNNVAVSGEQVTQEINRMKERELSAIPADQRDAVFKEMLARKKLTLSMLRRQVKLQLKLIKVVEKGIKVSKEEVRKGFEAEYGPKVEVSHILLNTEEAAKEALERITKKREPFTKVVEEVSIDALTAADKGRIKVPISHGHRYPKFAEAAFALKNVGEVSGVVKSDLGYHIIRLEKKIPASDVKLADVRNKVAERVRRARAIQGSQPRLVELLKSAAVQVNLPRPQ